MPENIAIIFHHAISPRGLRPCIHLLPKQNIWSSNNDQSKENTLQGSMK